MTMTPMQGPVPCGLRPKAPGPGLWPLGSRHRAPEPGPHAQDPKPQARGQSQDSGAAGHMPDTAGPVSWATSPNEKLCVLHLRFKHTMLASMFAGYVHG